MKKTKYPIWEHREKLPSLSIFNTIALMGVILLMCTLASIGVGGVIFLFVAGAVLGLLLLAVRSPLPFATVPIAFILSFAVSQSLETAAFSLMFVPIGLALAFAAFTGKNLSVTTVILTFVIGASLALIVVSALCRTYDAGIMGSIKAFAHELNRDVRTALSEIKLPVSETEVYTLTEEMIDAYIEALVMILPAVCIVTAEILAYITAKIFRLSVRVFGYDEIYGAHPWAVSLSTPAALIFLVSLFVGMLFTEPVIMYSAMNLMLIVMPAACIVGLNGFFGKMGIFKGPMKKSTKIIFALILCFTAFVSPPAFFQMLAIFASVGAVIRSWIISRLRKQGPQ